MTAETPDSSVVIQADRLIDGVSPEPISRAVISIEGERIVDVGPDLPIPSGARVIDLTGHTLLPGSDWTISGCIGQTYSTEIGRDTCARSRLIPQSGHAPGPSWRTAGCMGHV